MKLKKNDIVQITGIPKEIEGMPEETIEIFSKCVGKNFPISEVDDQQGYILYEIEVSQEITGSMKNYSDTIWFEPEYLLKK